MLPLARHSLRLRRWISGGVLLAMLFMQFAAAAFACPQVMGDESPQAAAMADMPDCHEAAASHEDGSALCKAHCVKDSQSGGATASPDLQANPAALSLLLGIIEPACVGDAARARSARASPRWQDRRSGAPPLYLSLLVLRN